VRGGAKNVGEIKFARQRICVGEMDSPDLVTLSAAASIFGGDRPIIFITNIIYSLRNSRLREKKKRQVSPVLWRRKRLPLAKMFNCNEKKVSKYTF
jgi:hypothetical protein